MRGLLVAFICAAVAVVALVAGASGAGASCAFLPGSAPAGLQAQIKAAPIAFVGTVIATSNNDRVARVRVESIWTGPVIPTLVTVWGTPDPASAATSVDRTFVVGARYLFVPTTATSPFQDNSCSSTQPYSAQLAALAPGSPQRPAPGSDGNDFSAGPSPWLEAGIVVLAFCILLALALLLRQRRRRMGPWSNPPGRA